VDGKHGIPGADTLGVCPAVQQEKKTIKTDNLTGLGYATCRLKQIKLSKWNKL